MDAKPTRSSKRITSLRFVLIVGCCFLGLCVVSIQAFNVEAYREAQKIGTRQPSLALVAKPVLDAVVAKCTGPWIESFGYSFQIPWNTHIFRQSNAQVKVGSLPQIVAFSNGAYLLISNPNIGAHQDGRMGRQTILRNPWMKKIFDAETFSSNYNFASSVLRWTPSQMKGWTSPKNLIRNSILCTEKSIQIKNATAIYELKSMGLRGFQIGDPRIDQEIQLDLFDGDDREYEIQVDRHGMERPSISQAEINAIVVSLHPIAAPSSTVANGN